MPDAARYPALPAELWHAWLTSPTTRAGSQLVVVSLRDYSDEPTLREILTDGVRRVPWGDVAENWDP